jgi:hypothetical protein
LPPAVEYKDFLGCPKKTEARIESFTSVCRLPNPENGLCTLLSQRMKRKLFMKHIFKDGVREKRSNWTYSLLDRTTLIKSGSNNSISLANHY